MVGLDFQTLPHLVENIALSAPACVKRSFRATSKHFCDLIDRFSFYHVIISSEECGWNVTRITLETADDVLVLHLYDLPWERKTRTTHVSLWAFTKILELSWLPFCLYGSFLDQVKRLLPALRPMYALDFSLEASDMLPEVDTVFANIGDAVSCKMRKLVFPHVGIHYLASSSFQFITVDVVVVIWANDDCLVSETRFQNLPRTETAGLRPRYKKCSDAILLMLSGTFPKRVIVVNAGRSEAYLRHRIPYGIASEGKWEFLSLEGYLATLDVEEQELTLRSMTTWDAIVREMVHNDSYEYWLQSSDEDTDDMDGEGMDDTDGEDQDEDMENTGEEDSDENTHDADGEDMDAANASLAGA